MRQILALSVAAAAFVALASPAQAANKEQQQLMADIRMLQEQTQQLQVLLGSLGEALKAVNARLDDQVNANLKAVADLKLAVDTLSSDLRVIREKVDDNNVRVSSLTQEVGALREAVVQPSAPRAGADPGGNASGTPGVPSAGESAGPPTPAPSASGRSIAPGTSPTRLYEMAQADYFSGLWDLAIDGFEQYIRAFPKSDLDDDAQVLIGNAFMQAGKNDKAVQAYDLAIRTYPNGNAIPEAYYKKGLALRNLKQNDQARQAFEYAVKTYPDSAAAALAKQALTQLVKP
jgi:tol-pal system protein YbgF